MVISRIHITPLCTSVICNSSTLTSAGFKMQTFVLQDGWTPLYTSCLKGHLDIVKTLIEAEANIDLANKVSTQYPHIYDIINAISVCQATQAACSGM